MTEIKIRKINLSDAMEIQKISREDLGYKCSLSLVEKKINSLDENREQVFVACKDGTVAEIWAKENGINYMRVNSSISRVVAHKFYQHLGYKSEKEQLRFIKQI